MVYTNTEVPLDFTPFSNLVSLDEAMSYITDDSNAEDIKNKLASLYGHFLQRDNYLSGLTDIFNTLGYTREYMAQVCFCELINILNHLLILSIIY